MDFEDELKAAQDGALHFANALRAIDGREPVEALAPGIAQDCKGCPVAMTAGNGWWVGVEAFKIGAGSTAGKAIKRTPVPGIVREFMAAFDGGAFPELDARRVVA